MSNARRYLLLLLFAGYLFVLLKITLFRTSIELFNIHFSEQNGYITSFQSALVRANFIPFHSIYYYLISKQEPIEVGLVNIIGNIILFIPFGFLLPLLWNGLRPIGKTLLIVFITSFTFETIQLVFAIGNFDIDDTLLNTLGGGIGYLIFAISHHLLRTQLSGSAVNKRK